MPLLRSCNNANHASTSHLTSRSHTVTALIRRSCTWSLFRTLGRDFPRWTYSLGPVSAWNVPAQSELTTYAMRRAASTEATTLSHNPHDHVHRFVKARIVPKEPHAPPSKVLIDALKEAGYDHAVPRTWQGRVNHSYISAWKLDRKKRVGHTVDLHKYSDDSHEVASEISLQSILANYIRSRPSTRLQRSIDDHKDVVDDAVVRAFDDKSLALLKERGYDIEDVVSWAWILIARSSEQAALRLLAISNDTSSLARSGTPTFVFLFLLRRPTIRASALRLLIIHAWDRIENRHNSSWAITFVKDGSMSSNMTSMADSAIPMRENSSSANTANYPVMSEITIAVMLVRLCRHVRQQWPAGYMSLAGILTRYIGFGSRSEQHNPLVSMDVKAIDRLAFVYNKMLTLLSLPSSHHPYLSISRQERAQFNVIRRMNDFEPALSINREGYRAVARVQLGHSKTMIERRWAQLKSKSWPPWKEEKLGTDADMVVDMGKSRAAEALSRLKESGYAYDEWEDTAMILAGWDTDRSPTIQTRNFGPPAPRPRLALSKGSEASQSTATMIWEARVRATRTVDEAWACFLSYKNEDLPLAPNVYLAMLEKLVFDEKHQGTTGMPNQPVLPGDGLETAPAPTDPRDRIYVRTPPPNARSFYNSAIADGIIASGRLLSFLLNYAETFDQGVQYLRASVLSPIVVRMLTGQDRAEYRVLRSLPQHIFSSLIGLLARSSIQSGSSDRIGDQNLPSNPLLHAIRLIFIVKPARHDAWNSLLVALAHKNANIGDGYSNRYSTPEITSWHSLMWLVDEMKKTDLNIDFKGFHTLCTKYEKVARQALANLDRLKNNAKHDTTDAPKETQRWHRRKNEADDILDSGLARLKQIFKTLVATDLKGWSQEFQGPESDLLLRDEKKASYDPSMLLPRLLEVPAPAHLHAFIRALGSAQDVKGICELLRWMEYVAPELKAAAEETNGGPRMFRRALVAARVMMERAVGGESGDEEQGALAEGSGMVENGLGRGTLQDEDGDEDEEGEVVGRTEVEQEAFEIVERVEGWGGWPTDEEVEEYLRKWGTRIP